MNGYIRTGSDSPLPPQLSGGSLEGDLRNWEFSNDSQDLGEVAAEAAPSLTGTLKKVPRIRGNNSCGSAYIKNRLPIGVSCL